jgi:predicted DNA-binding transcriptional regulator AlpA
MKDTIELDGKTYVSSAILMERFGVSTQTLTRWAKNGFLPKPVRLGHAWFYPHGEIDSQIRSRR